MTPDQERQARYQQVVEFAMRLLDRHPEWAVGVFEEWQRRLAEARARQEEQAA